MNQEPVIILATDTKIVGYGESDSSGCWLKLQLLPEHMDAIRGRRGDMVDIVIAEPPEPQCEPITAKPKATGKGEHGKAWALLYKSGWWYCPDVWPLFGTDADYQAWCRSQPCAIPGIPCEGDIVAAHVRRIALGAGMGIKPDYTTIPMCDTAHTRYQHQHGESAVGGKEHLDKLLAQYRTEWMKSVIREMFVRESCSQIEPGRFGRWVAEQADGLAWASLPKEFKS